MSKKHSLFSKVEKEIFQENFFVISTVVWREYVESLKLFCFFKKRQEKGMDWLIVRLTKVVFVKSLFIIKRAIVKKFD